MAPVSRPVSDEFVPGGACSETVDGFVAALRQGADWFDALLEAIGHWTTAEEVVDGREYRYLVGQEAFDWLVLAERLLLPVDGLVPASQRERLLFHGALPRAVSEEEFKERIGQAKYRAVMNYWYGVVVEEALAMAVEHEVRKQRRGLRPEDARLDDAVYERVYGLPLGELLGRFFEQRSQPPRTRLSLSEAKEFTYWLFKYRLKSSDPARVASDTRKALDWLRGLGREYPHGW